MKSDRNTDKAKSPDTAYLTASVDFGTIEAAAPDETPKPLKFTMLAYSGAAMRVAAFRDPVVIDLGGLDLGVERLPILADHMPYAEFALGHTTEKLVKDGQLHVAGVLSGTGETLDRVVTLARNGFPWQGSVGLAFSRVERVEAGQSVNVNGRTVSGPVNVIRASRLREVSFVVLGADDGTVSRVAASAGVQTMEPTGEGSVQAADPRASIDAANAEIAANLERVAQIQAKCKDHPDIAAKAIRENWTVEKAELESLRASRPALGSPAVVVADSSTSHSMLLAAALIGLRRDPVKDGIAAQDADAASKLWRSGIGLGELVFEAARLNGFNARGFRGNEREALRAAFSTSEISGILSNVANKVLLDAYMATEQAWRAIAATRPVRDFKQVSSYRLNGSMKFERVTPSGSLPHAAATEQVFTNKAETYGKMFSVNRQDLINDDLGAFGQQARRLGRGAGLGLNEIFWAEFLNNGSFFTGDRAQTGAGSALGLAGLAVAERVFLEGKDPDGFFLGARPEFLLVPTALGVTAQTIYASMEIRDTTASTRTPTANIFQNKYRPIVSAYIGAAGLAGGSNTVWYLLANPSDIPVIEVVFLNGQQEPTIETADADFDTLGIQMRGYFDFGVAKQDARGGVRNAGA